MSKKGSALVIYMDGSIKRYETVHAICNKNSLELYEHVVDEVTVVIPFYNVRSFEFTYPKGE